MSLIVYTKAMLLEIYFTRVSVVVDSVDWCTVFLAWTKTVVARVVLEITHEQVFKLREVVLTLTIMMLVTFISLCTSLHPLKMDLPL